MSFFVLLLLEDCEPELILNLRAGGRDEADGTGDGALAGFWAFVEAALGGAAGRLLTCLGALL